MSQFKASPTTITFMGIQNQIAAVAPFENYNNGVNDITTTLNHKYGIHNNQYPGTNTPRIQYFGLGVNGVGGTGSRPQPYVPQASDGDLYTPIPFRVRKLDQDLDEETKGKYRMREVREIDGETYALYWLKQIDMTENEHVQFAMLQSGEPPQGMEGIHNYVEMTPTVNESSDVVAQTVGYLKGICQVTQEEMTEPFNILAGTLGLSADAMLISEFGFYQGIERTGVHQGGDYEIPEAVYAQLTFHRCMIPVDLTPLGAVYREEVAFENGSLALIV